MPATPSNAPSANDADPLSPPGEPVVHLHSPVQPATRAESSLHIYRLSCKTPHRLSCSRSLAASWEGVARNQGAAGVDGVSIERFAAHAERYLDELVADLQAGRHRPSAVRRTYIPKPGGGKRPLGIPTVKDRIVQGALKRVLEPIFEWEFRPESYGFRPGRGAKDALRDVDAALKAGHHWVVDADLKGYFDSIPHDALMDEVQAHISDGRVLALIDAYLKADILDGLEQWTPTGGTPQGAVITPPTK